MLVNTVFVPRLLVLLGLVLTLVSLAAGQSTEKPPTPGQGEDVLRINTALVQTDVMVFDQHGRFVDGLRPQDFELRIDGQPRQISFFDQVRAGSRSEDSQLAAARGQTRPANTLSGGPEPLDRGRTIFFFVDDLHLAAANLTTARNLLLYYVDKQLQQNDEAAITSASGQPGFLQQVTDNKDVLHSAVARLKVRPSLVRDFERPPMSEYQALAIERNNLDVINHFVDELMKNMPSLPSIAAARVGALPRTRAEQQVRDRAALILQQSAVITTGTLSSLESLVRSAAKFPARKLVFFISDGFFLDLRNSDSLDRLRVITAAAARSGVVLYSVDVRGLVTGVPDASSEAGPDPGGRLQRTAGGELVESQNGMHALASDTGGRAILNTNSLESAINKALEETSAYYLLAWRPDNDDQKSDRFRLISVSLVGHPDLTVRMRQGFSYAEPPVSRPSKAEPTPAANSKEAQTPLRSAMLAAAAEHELPVSLSLTYVNAPDKGLVLTIAVQTKVATGEKPPIEVAGVVFNEEGKIGAQFADHVTGNRPNGDKAPKDMIYIYPVTVPSGLYQVRVGVRDPTSGAIGTAQDWIKIPDLSKTQLALSSLIISERMPGSAGNGTAGEALAVATDGFSVDHRFSRDSFLRFLLFLYSQTSSAKPDLAVQVQLIRDNQPVLTTSLRKVNIEGVQDLTKLAYAAEISLEHLPAGRYLLQVTAIDRATRQDATQSTRFRIE